MRTIKGAEARRKAREGSMQVNTVLNLHRWRNILQLIATSFALCFLPILPVKFFCSQTQAGSADPVIIVALGASDTLNPRVSSEEQYPAQLESLLKAKGIDVVIQNAGVPGDTPQGELSRVDSAAPPGTRLVLLGGGGGNALRYAAKHGGMSQAVVDELRASREEIVKRLQARNVQVIKVWEILNYGSLSNEYPSGDGRHLNAAGNKVVAESLVQPVLRALHKR
jgi:acyl-CoA thioesterase I